MASGIEDASVVDLVSYDAGARRYALIMVASQPWNDDLVLALQAKVKSYLSFVEEGQFLRMYPDARGKKLSFQVDTIYPLSPLAVSFIEEATRHWLEPLGIALHVHEQADDV